MKSMLMVLSERLWLFKRSCGMLLRACIYTYIYTYIYIYIKLADDECRWKTLYLSSELIRGNLRSATSSTLIASGNWF